VDWSANQVTVVDIHKLHATAQMFVVGVLLKRMMKEKEDRGLSRPLVFVVLDELNKYAPREGWSPIRELIRDIAERGRSLGVCLMGAQQTASEVEKRVVANSAIRVVGRLEPRAARRGHVDVVAVGRVPGQQVLRPCRGDDDDAGGLDLVDARVGGVEGAGDFVETNFAVDLRLEIALERLHVHQGFAIKT
jgi:DNA helicase HerA-like ATPase